MRRSQARKPLPGAGVLGDSFPAELSAEPLVPSLVQSPGLQPQGCYLWRRETLWARRQEEALEIKLHLYSPFTATLIIVNELVLLLHFIQPPPVWKDWIHGETRMAA